jgi:hypothetical protein
MVPAYREEVTITTYDNDLQLGVSQLHSGRKSQRTTVCRMERIGIHVPSRSSNTADA